MIDHRLPSDWKDLQNKVAEIFTDIGYETETDRTIETARGKVMVDVFSVDKSQSPNILYLCECKHWKSRVPKTVVHSFRTVIQDFGANYGIIISKVGFQKGAYETVKHTNITLVDWFGFQDLFEEKWLPAISEKLCDGCRAFIDHTEPIVTGFIARKFEQLGENKEKIEEYKKLRRKYMTMGFLILRLRYSEFLPKQKLKFPISFDVPSEDRNEHERKTFHSLRELVDFLEHLCKRGLKEFNELFDSNA